MDYSFSIAADGNCPVKGFTVVADAASVSKILFVPKAQPHTFSCSSPTPLHLRAKAQIEAYLAGRLQSFDLPIQPEGTPFQLMVWSQIGAIPFGETLTYGEIGQRLGDRRLARAVGQAANKNPLPLVIPCHRVLGKNGRLTGFAGGTATKAFLLGLERTPWRD